MADELTKAFAALADPTRRDMVARLSVGDATVGELAAPYAVSLQAVSKHVKVLQDAGLVSQRREAQRRPVHLEARVFDLLTACIDRYQRLAEERYQRLDSVLAELDEPAELDERADPDQRAEQAGPAGGDVPGTHGIHPTPSIRSEEHA